MTPDLTTPTYWVEIWVSAFIYLFWIWWFWYEFKKKRALPPAILVLVAFIFLCDVYSRSIGLYARGLKPDVDRYVEFMGSSTWWHTRIWPLLAVKIAIFVHIINKLLHSFVLQLHPRRRAYERFDLPMDIGVIYKGPVPEDELSHHTQVLQLKSQPNCDAQKAAIYYHDEYYRLMQHHQIAHDGIGSSKER